MKRFMIFTLCLVVTAMFGMTNVFAEDTVVAAEDAIVIAGSNEVEVGNEITLSATLSSVDVAGAVSWTSSDTSIATVDKGKVTGIKAGVATITATYAQEGTASIGSNEFKITVKEVSSQEETPGTSTSDEPDEETIVNKEKTVEKKNKAKNNSIVGTQTKSNPTTGLEDTLIYIVPAFLIIGSGLYLRKRFA